MDRPGVFGAVASHAGDAAFDLSLRPMVPRVAAALAKDGTAQAFLERVAASGPASSDYDPLFYLAAMAAYVPDDSNLGFALGFDLHTAAIDEEVFAKAMSHDPVERAASSAEGLQSLNYIFIDVGRSDEYALQFAARRLVTQLQSVEVAVNFEEFDGGHRKTSYRYDRSLPLLVSALDSKAK